MEHLISCATRLLCLKLLLHKREIQKVVRPLLSEFYGTMCGF